MKKLCSLPTRSTLLSILFCVALAVAASAQTFTSLADFTESELDPSFNSLVQGTDGNFYGTARYGGAGHLGTVYEVTPSGTVSVFYAFADGTQPASPLLLGADGNFYGTTEAGGATNHGTVFKLTSSGTLTTLYDFCTKQGCNDGANPFGPLVQGFDGNLYGATTGGGAHSRGTIFKITPRGTLTAMHTFCSLANCADGYGALGLFLARDGSMYGVASAGGTEEEGTIFRFTPAGQFKTLYNFCALAHCADGALPMGSLVVTATGTIYGTTEGGGSGSNGAVFGLTPSGTLTMSYRFCTVQPCVDGEAPTSGLIQATDGRLYGAGQDGGFNNHGTVFRITTAGAFARLHSFHANDGAFPVSALLQGTDGNIYGTTWNGGLRDRSVCILGAPYGCGTVFRESLGMKSFVKSVVRAGHMGDSIIILGNGLTGSTSVTFNGTAATFSVVSDTELTATVPTGATAGSIQVVTPSSTLVSDLVFRVLP